MELSARHLKAGYDKNVIIENMNLNVPAHKVTALIGANGCGKSTLLKTLCRIQPPLGGEVLLDGRSIFSEDSRELAKKVAILPQNPMAPAGLTVRELVNYGRAPHRSRFFARTTQEDKRMVEWALQETDMTAFADRPVEALSGGQRQRAWIAMAIAQDTEILFLDEPTSGIDPLARRTFWQKITALSERGTTIIITTHFMEEAEYCDRFMIQDHGRMLVLGSPEEIRQRMRLPDATMDDIFVAIVEQARSEAEKDSKAKGAVS